MDKEELIHLTLKQLSDSLESYPERLRLEDAMFDKSYHHPGPTIMWHHKIELNGQLIQDPNNSPKTIVISYNKLTYQLTCQIFFREVSSVSTSIMADASATITYNKHVPYIHRTYREFMALRKKLIKLRLEKEYDEYLSKLDKIFPAVGTEELFK